MKKKFKEIPVFNNEDEEREFWSKNDSTDYIDWKKADRVVLPNLKPSTRTISIRITDSLYYKLKQEANKIDIPYQSLIKMLLNECLKEKA